MIGMGCCGGGLPRGYSAWRYGFCEFGTARPGHRLGVKTVDKSIGEQMPEVFCGVGVGADRPRGLRTMSSESSASDVLDVDVETHDLVLVWDDDAGGEPDLRLALSASHPEYLELCIDELVLARVPAATGLTPDHVAMIPLSAALAMGWV